MRVLWNLALITGAAYVGFATILFVFQSRLIHLPHVPGRELTATPATVGLPYEDTTFATADDLRLHGWYIPAPGARRTLLFFHGNAGNIAHRLDSLMIFHRLELNTLIIDYRGYGQSEGTPDEAGLYQDAEAALRYLRRERGIALADLVFYGHSLGGAVATWLAARHSPGGLIIESTFTSIPAMAAELYPFLPTRLLTRVQYDTLSAIKEVCSPVLIIHSPDDEVIPFHHGQQLFAAALEPKRFMPIRGDHNGGFLETGTAYVEGIADFLRSLDGVNSRCPPAPG